MNESQKSERLSWLSAIMMSHRNGISKILLRLRDIAQRAGTNLSLHKKFMHMMDQVADEHKKEVEVLQEIEAIEKHHEEMRRMHLLRKANMNVEKKPEILTNEPQEEQPKPRGLSLLKILGILYLFGATKAKPKSPEPTVE